MDLEIDEQDQDRSPTPQSSISENSGSERGSERGSETPIDTPDTIETIEPVIISALPVTQLPAISLSGNNAQRTLWIGDVPTDWTEDTLNQVFTVGFLLEIL